MKTIEVLGLTVVGTFTIAACFVLPLGPLMLPLVVIIFTAAVWKALQ